MSITSELDWAGLRAVAGVVREALDAMECATRPGITTGELDALAAAVFERSGARSAPAETYGFPRTVLISVNDEIVHGIPGERKIARGDVVKLDVTAVKDGYVADAARTVVLPGAPVVAARLAACAREAFEAAAAVATAGTPVNAIGRAVETVVTRHGFSIIRGLEGHGVGRTIHEPPSVPNYCDPAQTDVLTEGLVITIEPIIAAGRGDAYEARDGWTICTRDHSLAAHHEHTLVITRGKPILLTAA